MCHGYKLPEVGFKSGPLDFESYALPLGLQAPNVGYRHFHVFE